MVITGNMFSEMQLLAEGATILSRQLQSSLLHILHDIYLLAAKDYHHSSILAPNVCIKKPQLKEPIWLVKVSKRCSSGTKGK